MDLACVAFTGVNSDSMGLVFDPNDEKWGFTSGVDGKNSILAAVSTRSSSDEVLGVSLVRIGRCWRQFLHRIENFDFNIDNRWVR